MPSDRRVVVAQSMARPSGLIDEAVAAANRGVNALEPLLQSAGVSIQVGSLCISAADTSWGVAGCDAALTESQQC